MIRRIGQLARSDDRGSLPWALLVTLIGASVGALLLPMVLVQGHNSVVENQRVRALEAAQAGLDMAAGQIRRANDGNGKGVYNMLPCGTISGSAGGGDGAQYVVKIDYYQVGASPVLINCTQAQSGVGLDHATLTSTGTAGNRARVLTATYRFSVTNTNIPGGLIPTFPVSGTTLLCMDAGSGSPIGGTPLLMQPCTTGSAAQTWIYNPNLTVELIASLNSNNGPMCVDAGAVPHTTSVPVTLRPCPANGALVPRMMWSLNDHANFEGTSDGQTLDNWCLVVKYPGSPGSAVILNSQAAGKCNQLVHDNEESWNPDAAVGPGAAGPPGNTVQLVNYAQFGRCLDVPGSYYAKHYMIVWPCKQAPDPTYISVNEKWYLETSPLHPSGPQKELTVYDKYGTRYCLIGPATVGANPSLRTCPLGSPIASDLEWIAKGYIQDDMINSYQYVDSSGLCLSPDDGSQSALPGGPGAGISEAIVVNCNSASGLLKWNALPQTLSPLALNNFAEN